MSYSVIAAYRGDDETLPVHPALGGVRGRRLSARAARVAAERLNAARSRADRRAGLVFLVVGPLPADTTR